MKWAANKPLSAKDKKLREAVLYISQRCEGDETFGATKLNKLLFYSDFLAYLNFGKSITGQAYFRLPKGPAPKRLVPVRDKMIEDGELKIKPQEYYGFPQNCPKALRRPDLSDFGGEEITLIEKVVEMHWGKTASEISDESHGFVGWKLANEQEEIPYPVALVKNRNLSGHELKYGRNLEALAVSVLQRHEKGNQDCSLGK
jgi:hypothetical protein